MRKLVKSLKQMQCLLIRGLRLEEVSMRGKVAKALRNKVYGGKSKRNQGATMTKTGLRCDQLRGDYQEEKKEYKSK